MRSLQSAAALLLLSQITACGLQASTGYVSTSADRSEHLPITTTATMQASRKSTGVIGLRSTQIFDDSYRIKQVILHGGYDYLLPARISPGPLPRRFALEGGVDLGAGGPVSDRFSGVGSYLGASLTPRYRFSGEDDLKRSFSILFIGVELVANLRWGAWFPPVESGTTHVYTEAAVETGLRIVFGSDITSAPQGRPTGDDRPDDAQREDAQ